MILGGANWEGYENQLSISLPPTPTLSQLNSQGFVSSNYGKCPSYYMCDENEYTWKTTCTVP